MFPLVRDLAAEGVPVRLTCGVLGFSPQAFYKWRSRPWSDRDWADAHLTNVIVDVHADDPEFGYRFIADELEAAGHRTLRTSGLAALSPAAGLVDDDEEGPQEQRQDAGPGGARRPGPAGLLGAGARCGVADRHHRAPDRRGEALLLRHQGRVLQPDRRLLDRRTDDRRARRVGAALGDRSPSADTARSWSTPTAAASSAREPSGPCSKANGLTGSMGRVAAAGDNAAMESFYALLQKNVLNRRRRWRTRSRAPLRDHRLDRAHLQPAPPPTRPRQAHPRRVRARLHPTDPTSTTTRRHDQSQPASTRRAADPDGTEKDGSRRSFPVTPVINSHSKNYT